ncbi:MAG: PDZ domain-containing protein [Nitrospirae bacterium]|nr:PDZ domain-containing protein [Nitrospirota bacterium]
MIRTFHDIARAAVGSSWPIGRSFAPLLIALIFAVLPPHPVTAATDDNEEVLEEEDPVIQEALELGRQFGIEVGEVDQEIADLLGLTRAEGVVVYEIIGGRPADLAGIKVRAIIKEIDNMEITNLKDFGRALKAALPTTNFSVATYEPTDPNNQGVAGGLNFHFVRVDRD